MPRKSLKLFARLTVLLASIAVPVFGQSTEADIKARLKDKPLYLRGSWRDNYLLFDADGKLIGKSDPISFTLSGFRFKSAHLRKDKLTLEGKRVGTEFDNNVPKRVDLDNMTLDIALPPGGDFRSTLDAVFADDLKSLASSLPSYWQPWARLVLLNQSAPANPTAEHANSIETVAGDRPKKVGGAVTAPRILERNEAQFNEFAKDLKYGGNVAVSFVVTPDGLPTRLVIVLPIGLGLDEQALDAVRTYRFSPALESGKSVASEVNIMVSFHIY